MEPVPYFFLIHSILMIASFVYLCNKKFFGQYEADNNFARIISWFILASFVAGICILANSKYNLI